jgi:hypothetical protein
MRNQVFARDAKRVCEQGTRLRAGQSARGLQLLGGHDRGSGRFAERGELLGLVLAASRSVSWSARRP